MAENEEEPKGLLIKVKEESEKAGLKLNIQKMKIMTSGPIMSWQIDGETVTDFIIFGSQSVQTATASIKEGTRFLVTAPWKKKSCVKPRQNIKKQKHHFANKGLYNQSCGFYSSYVQMRELDDKAECQ